MRTEVLMVDVNDTMMVMVVVSFREACALGLVLMAVVAASAIMTACDKLLHIAACGADGISH
jgi:hypothetical protein